MRRITGILLIVASVLGLVLALVGLVGIWSARNRAVDTIQTQVALTVSVLDTTAQGLDVADTALQTTQATVGTLNSTVQTLAKSITDTVPLMDSLTTVLGKDFPRTIETTQKSLDSAQASAEIIDNVLRLVTSIPFFPGDPYNPDVPLSVALGDVSRSLDSMPDSFRDMESNLVKTNANLALMQSDIEKVAADVSQVQSNLEQARRIISQYKDAALQLQSRLQKLQEMIPAVVNTTLIVITLFLLWLAIAQLGLLTQGLDLLKQAQSEKPSQ